MSEPGRMILLYSDLACDPTDPAELEHLRRTHFRLVADVVEEAGGTARILGDGCLVALEDPVGAFGCAATLRSAAQRHNRRSAETLPLRTALHAGEPITGEEDYLGAPVTTVRRLCAAAAPGRVLASADARNLLGDPPEGISFVDPAEALPFGATEVIAARPGTGLPADLVGPPDPLERRGLGTLLDLWKEAVSEGPRVVAVSGPPGVGKTTLLAMLAEAVQDEEAAVLYGSAAAGAGSFGAVAAALRPYLDACPERLRREHAREAGPAGSWLFPGAERPSGEPGEEARAGVLRLLSDVVLDAPLLLVLDDLHAGDAETLAVLEGLAGLEGTVPVLAVGLYTPGLVDRTTALWTALADGLGEAVAHVPLAPLPAEIVEDRIRGALGDAPDDVVVAVRDAADGNPFLLDQLMRHLEGVAARDRGTIRIPEGAAELLGHRFGRLSGRADDLLHERIVLDAPRFDLPALVDGLGIDGDRAERLVDELLEAGLVHPAAGDAYRLSSDLVREVAKREAAGDIARRETAEPPVEPEDMGQEALEVEREPAPEAEVDPPFSIETGAEDGEAQREELLEAALGFPEAVDGEVAGGASDPLAGAVGAMAALLGGDPEQARELATEAREGAAPVASVLGRVVEGCCLWSAGRTMEGIEVVEAAWATADGLDDPVAACIAVRALGRLHLDLLDPRSARAILMREVSKRRGPKGSPARRLLADALSAVDALSGRRDEARRLIGKTRLDPEVSTARPLVAFCDGRWDDAEELWLGARERAAANGAVLPWRNDALLARVYRLTGRPEAASELLDETLASVVDADIVPGELLVRAELTLLGAETGDLDEAMEHLQRCREIVGEGAEFAGVGARVLLARAVFEGAAAETVSARKFEGATEAFRRRGLPWDEAESLVLWGRASVRAGHPDGSKRLEEAVRTLEECGAGAGWRDALEVLVG